MGRGVGCRKRVRKRVDDEYTPEREERGGEGRRRKKKTGRGGARPGAGRKPELREPHRYSMDFEGPQMDALEQIASEREVSIASVVREAVDAYLARRRKR